MGLANKPRVRTTPARLVTKNGRGVLIYREWKTMGGKKAYSEHWTRRKMVNGHRYYFPLGTDRKVAVKTAADIEAFLNTLGNTVEQAIARFDPMRLERSTDTNETTIGDVLEAFDAARASLDISERTAAGYRDRLLWLVRYVRAFRRPF